MLGGLVRRRVSPIALLVLASALGLAVQAGAQETTGSIAGTVTDVQGGVLPGVSMTLRNAETGVTRATVSESDGRYRFGGLAPSTYDLKVDLSGFAPLEVKGLVLTIGLELRHDVTLKLQTLQEAVTVTAQAPVIETAKHDVAAVVTQQQIEALPVNNRQALGLAVLLPGTSQDGVRSVKINQTIGAGGTWYGSGFIVDGVHNQEVFMGEPRQNFAQASIREFKVNVSQFSAENGGGTGGMIAIVTRGGTNLFSGEAFEYLRDKSLNRMNIFEQANHDTKGTPKPAFHRNQYGASVGGPIIKDRLHFFGAFDRTKTDLFVTVNTGKPQFYSALEGSFPTPTWRNLAFGRGDFQINKDQNLFVRFAWERDHETCSSCGGTAARNSGTGIEIPRRSLVVGHTWVLSPRALNELRVQVAELDFFLQVPNAPFFEKVGEFPLERTRYRTIQFNFPSLQWGSAGGIIANEGFRQVRDSFTLNREWHGSHTWKMGAGYLFIPIIEDVLDNPGTWTFNTDQLFNPDDPATVAALKNPTQFSASFGAPFTRDLSNSAVEAFVQDDWKPRSNLTLNLGLRYDVQFNAFNQDFNFSLIPRPVPFEDPKSRGDNNNFGPRVGFAWDVQNNGKTVVRGGYGIYYLNFRVALVRGETQNFRFASISIRNPSYPDPYQGQNPLNFVSTAPQNIGIIDNKIKDADAQSFNVGISREISPVLGLNVDGVYTHMRHDSLTANINAPDPVTGLRPLPEFNRIDQIRATGESKYRALLVRLEKRYEHRYQYQVSYTLAKMEDNGLAGRVTDFFHPELDFGPATPDRRHALVVSGSVLLPGDVTFGSVWQLRSKGPFSALAGVDLNKDGFLTDFVPGTTRNQGNRNLDLTLVNAWRVANGKTQISASQFESSRFNSVDIRVTKAFRLGANRKLEAVAQVFNVFGTNNLLIPGLDLSGRIINALADNFGKIVTANPRQQAELGVRFVF